MAQPGNDTLTAQIDAATQRFVQQIDFFRQKLNLPTARWDDITGAAHDRAFIIAGAQKADLLADLRKAVDEAIGGGAIEQFRQRFADAVSKSGWTGWTGEGTPAGQAWRTRVIYQTNMATSYAAGRWRQLNDPDLLAVRPYWRYVHSDGVLHPRPQHLAWNGLTLRHDHPFWQTHFPPNGWGCQCRVVAVSAPSADNAGNAGNATEPPAGWDAIDPKTGAPAGIDKGWNYAPGARADDNLRAFVQDKLIGYPPAIERALSAEIKRHLNATGTVIDFVQRALADRRYVQDCWLGFVENPDRITSITGIDVKGYTVLLPSQAMRHVETSHGHDGGNQRLSEPQDFAQVLDVLNAAQSRLRPSKDVGNNGEPRVIASKTIAGETFETVWEVRSGKRNRALTLISLWIKTRKVKS